jgi:hypothetical protein
MNPEGLHSFLRQANSRFRFNFFLLLKLPAAYICGVRLKEVTDQQAVATVPYRWISQNPFRSIYFACQAMAAELSTGILAMAHIHGRSPKVSMLVVHLEADFIKKGTDLVSFTCEDGEGFRSAIEETSKTGEPVVFTARATGRNRKGEMVSSFKITWSFKAKS